jgi:uncharacterized LabA/DUF88 family protein
LKSGSLLVSLHKKPVRIHAFIDAFNFYHPLAEYARKKTNPENYKWLDYRQVIQKLLVTNTTLQQFECTHLSVYIFTSVPEWMGEEKIKRHELFIKANEYRGNIVKKGRFSHNPSDGKYKEKETDVSLAIEMYRGAAHGRYDVGMIFSADTDFVPLIKALKEDFPSLPIIGIMPPLSQKNAELRKAFGEKRRCKTPFVIDTQIGLYKSCPLPREVVSLDGESVVTSPY